MFEQNRTSHFGPFLTLFTMTLLWDYDTIIFNRQCWWCKPLGLFGDKKTPWHRHQADTRHQFIFPPLLSSEGVWWRGSSSWSALEFWVDLGHSIPSLYSSCEKIQKKSISMQGCHQNVVSFIVLLFYSQRTDTDDWYRRLWRVWKIALIVIQI